jgi:gamma-syntrophin
VSHQGRGGGLTLDWNSGFSLTEGADPAIIWQYKFSQLRGSSDDGKSKLKLHFQDVESRSIETKVSYIVFELVICFKASISCLSISLID